MGTSIGSLAIFIPVLIALLVFAYTFWLKRNDNMRQAAAKIRGLSTSIKITNTICDQIYLNYLHCRLLKTKNPGNKEYLVQVNDYNERLWKSFDNLTSELKLLFEALAIVESHNKYDAALQSAIHNLYDLPRYVYKPTPEDMSLKGLQDYYQEVSWDIICYSVALTATLEGVITALNKNTREKY